MAKPLKDYIDPPLVADLAERFSAVHQDFDADRFTEEASGSLEERTLKDRIALLARKLADFLPADFRHALTIVVEVARSEPPLEGFGAWPLCTFVELFGVDHPDEALPAMEHLTKRASCEFAIRPFLTEHFDRAYAQLVTFTASPDENVRRLASEGTRPRLPWGASVPILRDDPTIGLGLLTRLRHDPSATVRRSVANHLNDISKGHPALVVETARAWLAEEPPVDRRMVEHGLRTLVKRGSPAAMDVLGFSFTPSVVVNRFEVSPEVISVGDDITLEASIHSTSTAPQRLIVDFIIHHVTAGGTASPRVFKWSKLQLEPGTTVELKKRRPIRHGSTRTYRAGRHQVDLQVGGQVVATSAFHISET